MQNLTRVGAMIVVAIAHHAVSASGGERRTAKAYRSPVAVAISPDGKTIYASDATAGRLVVADAQTHAVRGEIALHGKPQGLCLSVDGGSLYVAEKEAGTVAVVDTSAVKVIDRLRCGQWPVAVAASGQLLFVCNQDRHTVSVFDVVKSPAKHVKEVRVVREPVSLAATPNGRYVAVANQIPLGRSTDAALAADVSIIDAQKLEVSATVKLPPGSTAANGVCTSPDGKWAYVVHGVGHFQLPMTQLERGWVNTYALSIIDLEGGVRTATVLLDDLMQGSADPWSVVCAGDGSRLYVSHAGVHEVSIVEIARLHELLAGNVSAELAALKDGTLDNVWVRIQQDRELVEELTYDLTSLYLAKAIRRVPSGGNGPRGITLAPDGKTLFAANYFSGSVTCLDVASGSQLGTIAFESERTPDAARRGELLFHDATAAFQRWHSCASCHPSDGRQDGLRWDFADDGLGNGMNTPSVLYPHKTEPLHRQGTLATTHALARRGLTFTHLSVPSDEQVEDLAAYMTSLKASPSPHLTADGKLTAAAQRGKAIFVGKAECATCHQGPYGTDQKLYSVGVITPNFADGKYKTTPLVELHRSAPYLHDGRALTLKEVLTTYNPQDEHGKTTGLSAQDIDDLVEYLLSL